MSRLRGEVAIKRRLKHEPRRRPARGAADLQEHPPHPPSRHGGGCCSSASGVAHRRVPPSAMASAPPGRTPPQPARAPPPRRQRRGLHTSSAIRVRGVGAGHAPRRRGIGGAHHGPHAAVHRRGEGVVECPACRPGNIRRAFEAGNRALSTSASPRPLRYETPPRSRYGSISASWSSAPSANCKATRAWRSRTLRPAASRWSPRALSARRSRTCPR